MRHEILLFSMLFLFIISLIWKACVFKRNRKIELDCNCRFPYFPEVICMLLCNRVYYKTRILALITDLEQRASYSPARTRLDFVQPRSRGPLSRTLRYGVGGSQLSVSLQRSMPNYCSGERIFLL